MTGACPRCGAPGDPADRYCRGCGQPLGSAAAAVPSQFESPRGYTPRHLAEKILTSRSALEGERKLVTVLFCDITGSTGLAEALGAEAMHVLLDRFFELALREVHRYEGTINQFLGDGFMALFGAPIAYEDHGRRAVRAALGLQEAIRGLSDAEAPPGWRRLALRIGLNTGPVVVGKIGDNLRMDYTAVGDTTNLAARLQSLAEPGTVYLSEATHRAVEGYADCVSLGAWPVKGRSQPVAVYRAVRARLGPRRGRVAIGSALVGRERELERLLARLRALVEGRGGVVSIRGEAGLGKSRLLREARSRMGTAGVAWVEGHGLSFGQGISYWPFVEMLRGWLGLDEGEADERAWAALEERAGPLLGPEADDVLPYLATLLGIGVPAPQRERVRYLDSEAMRPQILLSVRRLLERLAREQPLVLVVEDLHWVDRSSAELLEHLFPLTVTAPVLVCMLDRPDPTTAGAQLPAMAAARWPDRFEAITLRPLGQADTRTLIEGFVGVEGLPVLVADSIVAKAEGNPFFVEEVLHAMVDVGALVRDERTGQWRATAAAGALDIPDTVHGLIMARVDRLDDDVKEVLKTAAVIGRTFLYRIARAIADARERLDQNLGELLRLELIREAGRIPELAYIFRHTLVQEVAYSSILSDRRRVLHRLVAEALERVFEDRPEEVYGLLAYHYTRSEQWEKAHEYLIRAGDQAAEVAADAEALVHYEEAFRAYERVFGARWDAVQRATLERKMGQALFRRGDHARALGHFDQALRVLDGRGIPDSPWAIARAVGRGLAEFGIGRPTRRRAATGRAAAAARERIRIYEMLGWIDYYGGRRRLLLDMLLMLNQAGRHGLRLERALALAGAGMAFDLAGFHRVASLLHRRAVPLAEELAHPVALGYAYFGLALHENLRGALESAIHDYRRAAHAYRQAGHLRGWGSAIFAVEGLLFLRGDFAQSRELVETITRAGRDGGDLEVWGWGLQDLGMVTLWRDGACQEAATHLERAIELFKEVPDYQSIACASGYLGYCRLYQGDLDGALSILEESDRLMTARRLLGPHTVPPRNALAAAHLAAAERASGAERAERLRAARGACARALVTARLVPDGLPGAYRLRGTYEWLRGRPKRARGWWDRSLRAAGRLGARLDTGLTHLEMGRRLGSEADLRRAETLFTEIGDRLDGELTRAHLGRSAS